MYLFGLTLDVSWSTAAITSIIALLTLLLWRRHFSPINNIPGPFAASFTRLWHMQRILKGDQNLELIRLHDKHGHFVRVSYDEVSVSHPDAIRKILLAPLHKGHWYKIHALPDYRFQSPMSTTDPKKKVEKSKYIADWLDNYADTGKSMEISKYISFATFDVIGEVVFSKSFGFLEQGKDIGNAISNSLALNAYVAVAGYFRWVSIALLANPAVTWLSIMPMSHLFDTTKAVLVERANNLNTRFDAVQYWFTLSITYI